MGDKPQILVFSKDEDKSFNWQSVGWNSFFRGTLNTAQAKRLMKKAEAAIDKADTVLEAIANLEEEGFEVTRR